MAPPKYRLQALLILKERAKRSAEIELSKALKKLKEEEEKLAKLEQEREEILQKIVDQRDEMSREVGSGKAVMQDPQFRLNFVRKLKEDLADKEQEIEEQKQVIQQAETRVQRARQDYIIAAQEENMMLKHKELWEKKLQQQLNAEENKQMNELGQVIHQMNQKG